MIIKNGRLITPEDITEKRDIRIENGVISEIGRNLSGGEEIDACGQFVCPGFIDIHTHGGYGGDFMDASEDSFDKALSFHAENGTTAVLATSVTAPVNRITDMLELVRRYKRNKSPKCRVLGAHIEGPYLSLKNKGAQHASYLRVPSRDSYDFILENADVIKTVTIAPELDGAREMTKRLTEAGIIVCGGHDDGEKSAIMPVIDAGLRHCTHLWCAMSTVAMRNGVRSVGLCEIGLTDGRLTAEIIADNHHITPDMAKLVYKCKGAGRMCVVSDSLRAGGMPEDGRLYSLGSINDENAQRFIVSDGVAKLPDKTRYAGSIQPVSRMVRNLVNDAGIPVADAVMTGTLTPARVIGADDDYGSIDVGKAADLCFLDEGINVTRTIVAGRTVWRS